MNVQAGNRRHCRSIWFSDEFCFNCNVEMSEPVSSDVEVNVLLNIVLSELMDSEVAVSWSGRKYPTPVEPARCSCKAFFYHVKCDIHRYLFCFRNIVRNKDDVCKYFHLFGGVYLMSKDKWIGQKLSPTHTWLTAESLQWGTERRVYTNTDEHYADENDDNMRKYYTKYNKIMYKNK